MNPEPDDDLDIFPEQTHLPDEARAEELDVFADGGTAALTPLDMTVEEESAEAPTLAPADPASTIAFGQQKANEPISGLPRELEWHPRYRIVRLLGQGGMGSVYQAEHRLMDRPVALKVIHRAYTASSAAAERFRREVKTAARLHHPNIVTAFDAEEAAGLHFLVMEYVQGQSLGEYLRQHGRMDPAEACACIYQAALGLQYAHEQGMVHRDIKPDNLMRTPAGQIKILDFGLARFARGQPGEVRDDLPGTGVGGQLTLAGALMGTPDYVAPEQAIDSAQADIRADLYSLGCTFYQLLSGQVPFPGGQALEKVIRHTSDTPRPLASLCPDLPEELVAIVEKMMAKKPQERYQTPAEVAEAVKPFLARQPQARARLRWGWLLLAGLIMAALAVWFALR